MPEIFGASFTAVTPSQIFSIVRALHPQCPALFLGPPGIGKSQIIRQAAEAEAAQMQRKFAEVEDYLSLPPNERRSEEYYLFLDLRSTSATDVADIDGTIAFSDDTFKKRIPEYLAVFTHPQSAGLIFLDEITNEPRVEITAALYKIVLDRMIGWRKLSPAVKIIAAGNDPQSSSISNELPAPLLSRFKGGRYYVVRDSNEAALFLAQKYQLSEEIRDAIASILARDERLTPREVDGFLCQYKYNNNADVLRLMAASMSEYLLELLPMLDLKSADNLDEAVENLISNYSDAAFKAALSRYGIPLIKSLIAKNFMWESVGTQLRREIVELCLAEGEAELALELMERFRYV